MQAVPCDTRPVRGQKRKFTRALAMHKNTTSPLCEWPWSGLPTVREAFDNRTQSRRYARRWWSIGKSVKTCRAGRSARLGEAGAVAEQRLVRPGRWNRGAFTLVSARRHVSGQGRTRAGSAGQLQSAAPLPSPSATRPASGPARHVRASPVRSTAPRASPPLTAAPRLARGHERPARRRSAEQPSRHVRQRVW
jgi:hypothetical protein